MSVPVLHVVAGPDGAGKTTFVNLLQAPGSTAPVRIPFANADAIAAQRWPGEEASHAYDASRLAAAQRADFLARRVSFVTETVFSHHSKLDLIRRAMASGYLVYLHVVLVSEAVAVGRVHYRVERGGHSVPEGKVRQRYHRLWPLVAGAALLVDRATFHDNSRARAAFRIVADFERGRQVCAHRWPSWTPAELIALDPS